MTREISQEEIEEAAKFANAHQFIIQQQDGYNTLVLISVILKSFLDINLIAN